MEHLVRRGTVGPAGARDTRWCGAAGERRAAPRGARGEADGFWSIRLGARTARQFGPTRHLFHVQDQLRREGGLRGLLGWVIFQAP